MVPPSTTPLGAEEELQGARKMTREESGHKLEQLGCEVLASKARLSPYPSQGDAPSTLRNLKYLSLLPTVNGLLCPYSQQQLNLSTCSPLTKKMSLKGKPWCLLEINRKVSAVTERIQRKKVMLCCQPVAIVVSHLHHHQSTQHSEVRYSASQLH